MIQLVDVILVAIVIEETSIELIHTGHRKLGRSERRREASVSEHERQSERAKRASANEVAVSPSGV